MKRTIIILIAAAFATALFTSCSNNKPVQTYFVASHTADLTGTLVFVDDIKIISAEDATKIIYIGTPTNESNVNYGITTLPDAEVIELLPGNYTVEYKPKYNTVGARQHKPRKSATT